MVFSTTQVSHTSRHATPRFQATDYVLYNLGIRKEDVKRIYYRGNGWPGAMRVILNDGQVIKISNAWDTGFGKYFIPDACLKCTDVFSDYADISAGDPWLKEYYSDKMGTTFVITRNANAIRLIEGNDSLSISNVSFDKIYESQKTLNEVKTKGKNHIKRRVYSRLGKYKFLWRALYLKTRIERYLKRFAFKL